MVVSLTNPKLVVETFGLTPLEAMSAGLPVIVPTQGGIAEMVKDGNNGYKIDVQELDAVGNTFAYCWTIKSCTSVWQTTHYCFSAGF